MNKPKKRSGLIMKGCNKLKKNSPRILFVLGIGGMITTTFMAVKDTPKALVLIEEEKKSLGVETLTPIEIVKVAWKPYIPSTMLCILSIMCLIESNSVSTRRTTALATAYKLSEAALHEYKDAVIETIGENKEKTIRDKVAENKLEKTPIIQEQIVVTGNGNVLCFDPISGRYFRSNIDAIKRAVNEINRRLLNEDYISLNSFYDEIDLGHISIGGEIGWNISKDGYLDIEFSSHISKNNEPAIVLDYENMPRYNFDRF